MIEITEKMADDDNALIQSIENGAIIHEESFNCGYGSSVSNSSDAHREMYKWLCENRAWSPFKRLNGDIGIIIPDEEK